MTALRRGFTLVELLVALVLAGIVSAGAAAVLSGTERQMRRAIGVRTSRRTLREADLVLNAELRAASADSIRLLGDTAAEFLALVGTSVACFSERRSLVLPPAMVTIGGPYSVWRNRVESGDMVVAFDTLRGGTWRTASVVSANWRRLGVGCSPASGLLSAVDNAARKAMLVLELDRDLIGIEVGAPVRVLRRNRYVLRRGVDREWTLSFRRCALAGGCEASQPVVGELASPSDSGLIFTRRGAGPGLDVIVRVPTRDPSRPRDSRRLSIVQRNRAVASP